MAAMGLSLVHVTASKQKAKKLNDKVRRMQQHLAFLQLEELVYLGCGAGPAGGDSPGETSSLQKVPSHLRPSCLPATVVHPV